MITGLAGWALSALTAMPTPYLLLLLTGLFVLSFASIGLLAPHLLARVPAPALPRTEPAADRSPSLQKVRLIRNEIDEGTRVVGRAIGVSQVHDHVGDHNWIAHRNELAAIPDAGDAFRLAGIAWEGFARYNDAVKRREFISNEDLEEIVKDGRRAVDALRVAADYLR